MRLRLLLLLGFGWITIGGTRYGLRELTTRAWDARRAHLLELAEHGPAARRPWELRFEALLTRVEGERFALLRESAHRPYPTWGGAPPRALTPEERLWIEAGEHELEGLDGVLDEVATLDPARDNWGGGTVELGALRDVVQWLAARAWLALEDGDAARCVALQARTLALLDACDEGTSFAAQTRLVGESLVLANLHAGLTQGLGAELAQAELGPWLARCAFDPEQAERRIRRDLTYLEREPTSEAWDGPATALSDFRGVERALEIARLAAPESPWAHLPLLRPGAPAESPFGNDSERLWQLGTTTLHQRAALARVAEVALAVAAFQADEGRFPTTLAELALTPAQRLDPLTEEPLPYWTDGREARIGPAAWGTRVDPGSPTAPSPYLWSLWAPASEPAAPALGGDAD